MIQQISVFLENMSGRLSEVTKLLGENSINLRAITIADTADFGILRIIVSDTKKALDLLSKAGFTAKATDVMGIEIDDSPGGLANVMDIFDQNKVNIEYLYATLEKNADKAIVVFKVADLALGQRIANENNMITITNI